MRKIPLIVVAGPTASGKTSLAIELAKALDGEIVSADSMQIYKYMDIGTAKPTEEERRECPHHLIDIVNPDDEFSVADYTRLAHDKIEDITTRGKIAIMCGGTGLYINSVVNDVDFGEYENDYELRESLNKIAREKGAEALIKILAEFDSISAETLHPNNVKRIVRAIEFYKVSGIPISEHQRRTKQKESRYSPIMFLINHNREVLYERINQRVDIMLSDGLADEVKNIMSMGYTRDLNSMQGIGYKEMIAHFEGELSESEAIEQIKQNTRRYAKRQLTWFRRDERIRMLSPAGAADEALDIIENQAKTHR